MNTRGPRTSVHQAPIGLNRSVMTEHDLVVSTYNYGEMCKEESRSVHYVLGLYLGRRVG
jgi:hypothetical protein